MLSLRDWGNPKEDKEGEKERLELVQRITKGRGKEGRT